MGAQVLTRRTRDLLDSRDGRMPAGQELAGKRVACGIDAGTSRLRHVTRQQKGQGKSKKQRRRDKTNDHNVKLLIIDEIDETGEKVRTSCPWIDGTFGGPDEAMELLAMHLHRLGAVGAGWWRSWPTVHRGFGSGWSGWPNVWGCAISSGISSWTSGLRRHTSVSRWGMCREPTRNDGGCTGSCGSGSRDFPFA